MATAGTGVRRVRRVASIDESRAATASSFPGEGFGSVPGESPDEFHDRMFEIPALEALMYETEFAINRCDRH